MQGDLVILDTANDLECSLGRQVAVAGFQAHAQHAVKHQRQKADQGMGTNALGQTKAEPATPESLWIARQVGLMLQKRPMVAAGGLASLLATVVERMAQGRVAVFARRYGFSKSGVWYWLNKGGLPGIKAWLTIALHGGIGLDKLFAGDIEGWVMRQQPAQMVIPLPESPRTGIRSRELDWDAIRASLRSMLDLPAPVSINEASHRVGVGRKHLYLRANAEARAVADRHRRSRASVKEQREEHLHEQISEVLEDRLAAGYEGMSARDIWKELDAEGRSVPSIFQHINTVLAARCK
jgi:hypothetical protein